MELNAGSKPEIAYEGSAFITSQTNFGFGDLTTLQSSSDPPCRSVSSIMNEMSQSEQTFSNQVTLRVLMIFVDKNQISVRYKAIK